TRISSSFERRGRANKHTSANRFRTTRYANDQSNQPSLDQDKSAEPTELDAPESLGRVCEPYALWRSRNDKLARWFGDPTDDLRREWIRRLGGPQQDFTIGDYADRSDVSVTLLGDTGEGDGSQYALVPGLLKECGDSDFMFILSDVIYPAGGIDEYEDKFYRPYKDYQ